MLSNNKINEITQECKRSGHDVRVRDIAYVLLTRYFDDIHTAHKCVFGGEDVPEAVVLKYSKSKAIKFLTGLLATTTYSVKKSEADISFEENRAYMLSLRKQTEEALAAGEMSSKDAMKILAQISVNLNDKFNVSDNTQEQQVLVNQKFNAICPYCSHEVAAAPISKEEAITMYNLVEKTE